MTKCPDTGVSVPECSCGACLQALIERHMPSLLARPAAQPQGLDQQAAALKPPSGPEHRAA